MGNIEPGMTVLVTGATGFVGGAVVRALCAAGYQVIALVRSADRAAGLPPAGTRPAIGDMTRPETYRPLVRRADAVVHAAQVRIPGRVTERKLARSAEANATMTAALASACAEADRRLLYTSGCFGYGDRGPKWISEETPLAPSPLGVDHARQVTRLRALRDTGLDVVVLHLGFVYGPGGNFKSVFYNQARKNRLRCIGDGSNYWSPVHVDDAAAAYIAALERAPAGAEYTIVDDTPLTLRALVDHLTDTMGKPSVGNLPTGLASMIVGRPAIASLTTSYRVSNARSRDQLGWTPRFPAVAAGFPSVIAELENEVSRQKNPRASSIS